MGSSNIKIYFFTITKKSLIYHSIFIDEKNIFWILDLDET